MINLDDYGDDRAWHEFVDTISLECDECEEEMVAMDRDLTAELVVFECPNCEHKQSVTIRRRK